MQQLYREKSWKISFYFEISDSIELPVEITRVACISYWPSYRSKVCCIASRPRANTADREPVTGIIQNYLINDNFIN